MELASRTFTDGSSSPPPPPIFARSLPARIWTRTDPLKNIKTETSSRMPHVRQSSPETARGRPQYPAPASPGFGLCRRRSKSEAEQDRLLRAGLQRVGIRQGEVGLVGSFKGRYSELQLGCAKQIGELSPRVRRRWVSYFHTRFQLGKGPLHLCVSGSLSH